MTVSGKILKKVIVLLCFGGFVGPQVCALDWMTQDEFNDLYSRDLEAALKVRYELNVKKAKAYLLSLRNSQDSDQKIEFAAKSCFAALSAINIERMWCQRQFDNQPSDQKVVGNLHSFVWQSMSAMWEPAAIMNEMLSTHIKTDRLGFVPRELIEKFEECIGEVTENTDKQVEMRTILNAFLNIHHHDMPGIEEVDSVDMFDSLVDVYPYTMRAVTIVLSIINYFILGNYGPEMFEQYFTQEAENVCGDAHATAYCSVKPAAAVALTGFEMALFQRVFQWLLGDASSDWWSEVRVIIENEKCGTADAAQGPQEFWQCWDRLHAQGRIIDTPRDTDESEENEKREEEGDGLSSMPLQVLSKSASPDPPETSGITKKNKRVRFELPPGSEGETFAVGSEPFSGDSSPREDLKKLDNMLEHLSVGREIRRKEEQE